MPQPIASSPPPVSSSPDLLLHRITVARPRRRRQLPNDDDDDGRTPDSAIVSVRTRASWEATMSEWFEDRTVMDHFSKRQLSPSQCEESHQELGAPTMRRRGSWLLGIRIHMDAYVSAGPVRRWRDNLPILLAEPQCFYVYVSILKKEHLMSDILTLMKFGRHGRMQCAERGTLLRSAVCGCSLLTELAEHRDVYLVKIKSHLEQREWLYNLKLVFNYRLKYATLSADETAVWGQMFRPAE